MSAFSDIEWHLRESVDGGFEIELHPSLEPSRTAAVFVSGSAEVFAFSFAGHEPWEFAYTEVDKAATLAEQVESAVAAVRGPTQVVLDWAGGKVARSGLTHFPDGRLPGRSDISTGWLFGPLAWWLRGRRLRREILSFPALAEGAEKCG